MTGKAHEAFDVAVIGAGSVDNAVGYDLVRRHGVKKVALVDPRFPTTALSGSN